MTPNPYDQACRYLLKLSPAPLLAWLLRLPPTRLEFVEWLDARQVPWPGQPDRVCDTVAHVGDTGDGGRPWAVVVEFQVDPDELMLGRGLRYLGDLWLACKPTEHRGDRFELGLVVVNLRGEGTASRTMRLKGSDVWTGLGVGERNFSTRQASRLLKQVEGGEVPRAALAWVPLFKGGGRPGIIQEWKRLAELEPDTELRRALGLAIYFAEAAGCGQPWQEALKEWNMIESKIFNEWTAKARRDAENKTGADLVIDALTAKFADVPADLAATIRACTDQAKFRQWMRQVILAPSLEEFRTSLKE